MTGDNCGEKKQNSRWGRVCLSVISKCLSGWGLFFSRNSRVFSHPDDQQQNRSLFPTHNPTHRMRCLVRLTRCLAVPAVLDVVVKPNHATLIRARSVAQVHPGPP
jgi:hypothetical protein